MFAYDREATHLGMSTGGEKTIPARRHEREFVGNQNKRRYIKFGMGIVQRLY